LSNHGEAQGAESGSDFVHKMSICYKELRESYRWLRLTQQVPLVNPPEELNPLIIETEELVKIFAASLRTAKGSRIKMQTASMSRSPTMAAVAPPTLIPSSFGYRRIAFSEMHAWVNVKQKIIRRIVKFDKKQNSTRDSRQYQKT
jgi:hypothetical protein